MNNNPCCHKCARPIPFNRCGEILKIGNDKERLLCTECANLIRKFVDKEEMTVEELTKLDAYKKGYDAGYDDGLYDQWEEMAGDDL